MKILAYGGAFNPPHKGHMLLLAEAMRAVEPDITFVIPSDVSPHKRTLYTPFYDRAAMCRCFKECGAGVVVSEIEKCKNRKKSYTVKTLRRLRDRYPGAELYFVIGSDSLFNFKKWHQWRRILTLCTLVIAARDDESVEKLEEGFKPLETYGGRAVILRTEPVDISSTELRKMVSEGRDCSEYLPKSVSDYIEKHGLYKRK